MADNLEGLRIMPNESNRSAETRTPLRILFLCTGNSARSQIAEALLTKKGGKHFVAGSAGVDPQPAVHPGAIKVLADYGIDWSGHTPKSVDQVGTEWDLIITVCDRARESCPTFPGHPIFAHWGMPDPAAIDDETVRRRCFQDTVAHLSRRIDLMLALPFESLERTVIEARVQAIGKAPSQET